MCMNVLQALHYLKENAFDTAYVETFVIPGLHQLIKIAIHVLHGDVELLAERIQEDIQGWDKVVMRRKRSEEDDFSELQTRSKGFEVLLHRLYRNLHSNVSYFCNDTDSDIAYNSATSCNVRARRTDSCKNDAAEAAISYVF